jgi:hypothetical protein
MRSIPGGKADIEGAQWMASLPRAGSPRGGSIPGPDARGLRTYARRRGSAACGIGAQKNRVGKLLRGEGLKPSSFLADIFGLSGRNLLKAPVKSGAMAPSGVEAELRGVAKKKGEEMRHALNGRLDKHGKLYPSRTLEMLDDSLGRLEKTEAGASQIYGSDRTPRGNAGHWPNRRESHYRRDRHGYEPLPNSGALPLLGRP